MEPAQETEKNPTSDETNGAKTVSEDQKEGEEGKALFDQPLVLEGKRKRKSTELFSFSEKEKMRRPQEYTKGEGVRLGDIPFIEHNIAKVKSDHLKALFRLCYDRTGSRTEIKRSLRDFTGYSDKELIEKKHGALDKMHIPGLKTICDLLGLETSGKKEDIVTRIIEFLTKPVDLGKEPKKRRRSSAGSTSKGRKKSKPSESDDEEDEQADEQDKSREDIEDDVMETSQTSTDKNGDVKENDDEKPEAAASTNEEKNKKDSEPKQQEEDKADSLPAKTVAEEKSEESTQQQQQTSVQEKEAGKEE